MGSRERHTENYSSLEKQVIGTKVRNCLNQGVKPDRKEGGEQILTEEEVRVSQRNKRWAETYSGHFVHGIGLRIFQELK